MAILFAFVATAKAQVPTPNPSDGSTVCVGTQLVYGPSTIDPSLTYNFTINPVIPFTVISGGSQIEVLWSSVGTYTISYDDNDPCTISNSATIVVQDAGIILINPITECQNTGMYNITSNQSSATYTLGGFPVTVLDTDILAPGTYTVNGTFTDANGCISTGTQTLTILPPTPLPSISNN